MEKLNLDYAPNDIKFRKLKHLLNDYNPKRYSSWWYYRRFLRQTLKEALYLFWIRNRPIRLIGRCISRLGRNLQHNFHAQKDLTIEFKLFAKQRSKYGRKLEKLGLKICRNNFNTSKTKKFKEEYLASVR